MSRSEAESLVLERFREKCLIAGGAKAGYVLRRESIEYGWSEEQVAESERELDSLVDRGLLAVNEDGSRYFLTEEGASVLTAE